MPADLPPPPPIAIHAPVPQVKTQTGTSMNHRSVTRTVVQQLGTLGNSMVFANHPNPIFLGGKNNHRRKKTNMLHASKKSRKRHKRNS